MKSKTAARSFLALTLCAASLAGGVLATADGGVLSVSIRENSAPVAQNIECATYRGIPVVGAFSASDPDGDGVTFTITSQPKYGSVEMSGTDAFTYTPSGRKSSDSFTYTAEDEHGAVSAPATVTVTVKKRQTAVSYPDMEGNPHYYAALRLAEEGIFTGKRLGTAYFFEPESEVTRGEFLAMCMSVCGADTLDGVSETGFFDDGDIPGWVKPYIASALQSGDISGYADENGNAVFSSEAPVTFAEASVMLDNLLDVTDAVGVSLSAPDNCPVWAYQAAANLSSAGVLSFSDDYSAPLSRAQAAEMLSAALDMLEARKSSGIFSWLE